MAELTRLISEQGGAFVIALDSTPIVQAMFSIHKTSPVCSAALGRLLTGAALMSSTFKNETDTLTLRIKGDGPAGALLAVANGKGEVKGWVQEPRVALPLRADGKLDVGGAVGHHGLLTVIRDTGLREPYIGQTPLVSGEIAEDITAYYAASEQIPTVCALGVLVDRDYTIRRAGGYLLQLLPGASEEEITRLEKNVGDMKSVTRLLEEGVSEEEMGRMVLKGFGPELLDRYPAVYHCDCSRQRMEKALISLGRKELTELQQEKDELSLSCQFCNRSYTFSAGEILEKIS